MLLSPNLASELLNSQRPRGKPPARKPKARLYDVDMLFKLMRETPLEGPLSDPLTGEPTAAGRRIWEQNLERDRQAFIRKYGFDPDKKPALAAQIKSAENHKAIAKFVERSRGWATS